MSNYTSINNDKKEELECLICFYDIDIACTYVECHTCKKKFHEQCMNTWKDMQNKSFSVCVHCSENNLLLHKTGISCCCWFPIFKKNTSNLPKTVSIYN